MTAPPTTPVPVVGAPFEVPAGWIDHNDHMNLARYSDAFYIGARQLSDALGFTREFKERTETASFAANLSIAYRREVRAGSVVRVESRVISYDSKRIHSWHELVLHDDETIAATGELLGLNISTATRRVADMPDEALDRLAELVSEHERLPRPDGVSASIGIEP